MICNRITLIELMKLTFKYKFKNEGEGVTNMLLQISKTCALAYYFQGILEANW